MVNPGGDRVSTRERYYEHHKDHKKTRYVPTIKYSEIVFFGVVCFIFMALFAYVGGYEMLNVRQPPKLRTHHSPNTHEHKTNTNQLCCYFGQHYHQCYTGKAGCDIGGAIAFAEPKNAHIFNGVQVIKCSSTNECPGLFEAGFFLRGFRYGCPECTDNKD